MYFKLNPECYFIKGNRRGAIFDLIDNKIYALNQRETELITHSEKNLPVPNDEKFLKDLKQHLLGNFYSNKTYIYKMKASSPFAEKEVEEKTLSISRAFLEINNSCMRDCWFCGQNGIKRSLGCIGCNKWNEGGKPLEIDRWKKIVNALQDLNCQHIFMTGGDLTLIWDRAMELLDYANDKFSSIYMILHQDSLLESHLKDLNGRAKPIIQTNNLNNVISRNDVLSLLVVTPEHWDDIGSLAVRSKNLMFDFVTKNGYFNSNVPIMSKDKIIMPGMIQFLHNMRYHPCIGNTLAISHTGNVFPCPMMRRHSLGNVEDRELYTIFEKGGSDKIDAFWKLTLDKIDKCRGCEFKYSCGDCRALEESLTGRLDGKKVCSYDPEKGIWL